MYTAHLILALLSATRTVLSFGTIDTGIGGHNLLSQHGEHEKITRAALACQSGSKLGGCFEPKSLNQLAGDDFNFGAVGDPDKPRKLNVLSDTFVEGKYAHCDDADFLVTPEYPRSRNEATAELQGCVSHLRARVQEGVEAARLMLTVKDLVNKDEVMFDQCAFQDAPYDVGKCKALQGFGRALHGVQDFYAHSNWADQADPKKTIDKNNPPGLHYFGTAPFLDLRSNATIVIGSRSAYYGLSTGCYAGVGRDGALNDLVNILPFTEVRCDNRVQHGSLNKDEGIIDPVSGDTSKPGTDRGEILTNFDDAVHRAIADTRRQWRHFTWELDNKFGSLKASRMACALTKDEPLKDCQGRKVAIVVDSSSSNTDTDPKNIRISSAKAFNDQLITKDKAGADGLSDLVTIIDFDSSAKIVYPLGDPAGAAAVFSKIDSSGGTYIAGGIKAAIDEIDKEKNIATKDKSGIIVYTDGQDSDVASLIKQINRARDLGIRVWFGWLKPSGLTRRDSLIARQSSSSSNVDLQKAITETGGTWSTITNADAQKDFMDLINSLGLTTADNSIGLSKLKPGISTLDTISYSIGEQYYLYKASSGQRLNITVSVTKPATGAALSVALHDIDRNQDVQTASTDTAGKATIVFDTACERELELVVTPGSGLTASTLFSIELQTSSPININPEASCELNLAPPPPSPSLRLVEYGNSSNISTTMTTPSYSASTTTTSLTYFSNTTTNRTTSTLFGYNITSNSSSFFYPPTTITSTVPSSSRPTFGGGASASSPEQSWDAWTTRSRDECPYCTSPLPSRTTPTEPVNGWDQWTSASTIPSFTRHPKQDPRPNGPASAFSDGDSWTAWSKQSAASKDPVTRSSDGNSNGWSAWDAVVPTVSELSATIWNTPGKSADSSANPKPTDDPAWQPWAPTSQTGSPFTSTRSQSINDPSWQPWASSSPSSATATVTATATARPVFTPADTTTTGVNRNSQLDPTGNSATVVPSGVSSWSPTNYTASKSNFVHPAQYTGKSQATFRTSLELFIALGAVLLGAVSMII